MYSGPGVANDEESRADTISKTLRETQIRGIVKNVDVVSVYRKCCAHGRYKCNWCWQLMFLGGLKDHPAALAGSWGRFGLGRLVWGMWANILRHPRGINPTSMWSKFIRSNFHSEMWYSKTVWHQNPLQVSVLGSGASLSVQQPKAIGRKLKCVCGNIFNPIGSL